MHAKGEACLSLFFFDICVPFDVTVGDALAEVLSAIDPWPSLQAAIGDARNWATALLPGLAAVASVGAPKGSSPGTLVEPMGGLTLRQTVVPLNRTIDRFGELALQTPTAYTVQTITVGGSAISTWNSAQDHFAPAQFQKLSDAEKLSRASFELMDAGVTLAGGRPGPGRGDGHRAHVRDDHH